MTIAILGSGPAGLFAAHALAQAGEDFHIFSKGEKSEPVGPQFLLREIEGVTGRPISIEAVLRGTAEGYKAKSGMNLPTMRRFEAWDLRAAYDKVWALYRDRIEPADFDLHPWFLDIVADQHDEVISTIPAPLVCRNLNHVFESRTSWITDNIKAEQGEFQDDKKNVILYSGDEDDWWYVQSRVLGQACTEFPKDKKPWRYQGKVTKVQTPVHTDCTCYDEFHFEGRLGSWDWAVDAYDAYQNTAGRYA
jgi:hypothetical protein